MGFVKEFRDFAIKGNVFDMAIGVIMGGAFGKIVTSLIDNILNPVIGRIAGGIDFANNYVNISGKDLPPGADYASAKKEGAVIGHGAFISDVINFLIMAFVVFLLVKAFTAAKKKFDTEKPPAAAPAGPSEKDYLKQIAESLARRPA